MQPDQSPWAGIHLTFSNIAWNRLPRDLQQLSEKQFNQKALEERADWQVMTKKEVAILTSKGLTFNSPDPNRSARCCTRPGSIRK